MVKVYEDMTGWKMWEHGVPNSRLTVVDQVEDYVKPNGVHEAQWKCVCSCKEHNEIIVLGYCIKSGTVRSCGCLRKETATQSRKDSHKTNKYDLSGEYGIGWTENTNQEFYFDLEDYNKIKDYCWSESVDKQKNYRELRAWDVNSKKNIKMHQLILGNYYDHINRNTLDNRKENLRKASFSENTQNRSVFKNNTSQITGVHQRKQDGMWVAYISKNKKRIYLGYFNNKNDAIKARLKAEKEYFGKFAPQRHLFEQYNIALSEDIKNGRNN